ncbi:hypothetical protein [Deinococcus radiotolerans]|uniref:Uncharacterized protein n=1 Tax=Deinococcus radiotolerans TaxID=1309407 RepID=A0ABQ2FNV0_9DEIO|nr:hypothetical protein [Deinococcus radiotolerans]GGL12414.1 hypothetical protein GCM10010844_33890 [Deinococcus radiotolerans]
MRDTPFLLARVHLPEDDRRPCLIQKLDDPYMGPMDGSVFSFHRAGELVKAYTWWENHDPEVIGRGGHGVIRIMPMTLDLWTHMKPGTSLAMTHERLHAQVTQSLMENQA